MVAEQPPYLDVELLCETIRCIDEVLESWGSNPALTVRGRMIGILYERCLRSGSVKRETVERYLKLVM